LIAAILKQKIKEGVYMLDHISIGNQIASLRKQNGFTQEDLAEKLDITAQAISKWENGHTLPETAMLPLLSKLLKTTIDILLMPYDAFEEFANSNGSEAGKLALLLYQKLKERFAFTVCYDDKFNIFEEVHNGGSATFIIPDREDFLIRIDIEKDKSFGVRVPLPNCSKYIAIIERMPEYIKCNFKFSDCKCCKGDCEYTMVYELEGTDYRQCHFITITLNSSENMEHLLALLSAEHGK
jgi:transcriptional regulator with XRE-family HTH domain